MSLQVGLGVGLSVGRSVLWSLPYVEGKGIQSVEFHGFASQFVLVS